MTKIRTMTGPFTKSILHVCPGCNEVHSYIIERNDNCRPLWSFNGDFENPTLTPSMLITVTETEDADENPLPAPIRRTLCHYFITDGKIIFCGDSPHALSGQTVDLPDWPYAPGTYGGIDE